MAVEVRVKISDEQQNLSYDEVIYEDFRMTRDDPVLMRLVRNTKDKFKSSGQEPPRVVVKTSMEWE